MSGDDHVTGLPEGDRLAVEVAARLGIGSPEVTPVVDPVLTARCPRCKKAVMRVYPTSVGHLAMAYVVPWDGHRHDGDAAWSLGWVDGTHHTLGETLLAVCRCGEGPWDVNLAAVATDVARPRRRRERDPLMDRFESRC